MVELCVFRNPLCLMVLAIVLLTSRAQVIISHQVHDNEKTTWSCEPGWIPFTTKGDYFCLMKQPPKAYMTDAIDDCEVHNASLISIHSKEKNDFMRELMKTDAMQTIWIGLKSGDAYANMIPRWIRRDGTEKVDYKPSEYQTANGEGSCYMLGIHGSCYLTRCYSRYTANAAFYCEKRPTCIPGTFGGQCENTCHCYGELCNSAVDVQERTCKFGCQPGWMGTKCDKPKVNAKVTYYCVNSEDHGTYMSIMIDTKGVTYRNIHGLNSRDQSASWCSNTVTTTDQPKDFINIKVYPTLESNQSHPTEPCAGKLLGSNAYELSLVIQERKGIMMANDQRLKMTCNFTKADHLRNLQVAKIRGDDQMPFQRLEVTQEVVQLELTDAFSGEAISSAALASPVRLKMSYGFDNDSLVQGVVPYDCEMTSMSEDTDKIQKQALLDHFGCAQTDLVSSFHKINGSNSVQTDPFPFYGFEGSDSVTLQCSFTFCYSDKCKTGCDMEWKTDTNASEHEQHTDNEHEHGSTSEHHRIRRSVSGAAVHNVAQRQIHVFKLPY